MQQVVAFYLGDDEMQFGVANHLAHHLTLGISAYLFHCFVPLLLCIGFGGCHRKIFQFDDVGMADVGESGQVGHKEEVTVAMVKLHLWACEIIRIESKHGVHKTLEVALSLDEAAHRSCVVILAADALKHLAPLSTIGCESEGILKVANSQRLNLVIFHQHIIIILLTYIIVGDTKYRHTFLNALNCHHAIIEQKALEHVRVGELVGREGTLHPAVGESILGNLQENVPPGFEKSSLST